MKMNTFNCRDYEEAYTQLNLNYVDLTNNFEEFGAIIKTKRTSKT